MIVLISEDAREKTRNLLQEPQVDGLFISVTGLRVCSERVIQSLNSNPANEPCLRYKTGFFVLWHNHSRETRPTLKKCG